MTTCIETITPVLGDATYFTTYKEAYKPAPGDILPPIKYNQPPGIQHKDINLHQLPPRQFPVIPCGPHRRRCPDRALGPGLGTQDMDTERHLAAKPIVRTLPPRDLVNEVPLLVKRKLPRHVTRLLHKTPNKDEDFSESIKPFTKEIVDAICHDVTYTSTTRLATEEAKLPMRKVIPPKSTFEINSDMVKNRPHKYEQYPELWQSVACVWDRVQNRPKMTNREVTHQSAKLTPSRLLPRRAPRKDVNEVHQKINKLVKTEELATPYVPQCPGYAGFRPRSPIEASLRKQRESETHQTIMTTSYRPLPVKEYDIKSAPATNKHHHLGPFSRTVTLTYPYNPFK